MPSPKKLTARAEEARIDETHRCPRDRTALRVVDMQHGFLEPGASLEVPKGRAVIPRLRRLIAACRADGVPVMFTQFVYASAILDDAIQSACLDIWRRKIARLRTSSEVAAELRPTRRPSP